MKKILLIIGLALASLVAYAGPFEELSAAFKAEQEKNLDKVIPMAVGQTALRGYLATQAGMVSVPTATSYFGYLVPKAVAQNAIVGLGFVQLPSQGTLDTFAAMAGTQYVGFTLLVFYDANENANEIYLMNTKLP